MPLHAGLLLGLLLMAVVGVVLRYTVLGCSCMRWGSTPGRRGARPAGTAPGGRRPGGRGRAGRLAGACMLQGEQYSLKAGFSSGYGFDGLVVGLLARNSVWGVLFGALLFGFLRSGGINLEMVASVPTALVVVIQGLIIITLAGAAQAMDRQEVAR
jgi:simple sugar transport system permease protein